MVKCQSFGHIVHVYKEDPEHLQEVLKVMAGHIEVLAKLLGLLSLEKCWCL